MSARRRLGAAAALALITFSFAVLLGGGDSSAARKKSLAPLAAFNIGVDDSGLARDATAPSALARAFSLHASYVRILVDWSSVAPNTSVKPRGFAAREPGDPLYRWGAVDAQVRRAVAGGFTPYLLLVKAPRWAQDGSAPPSALAGDGAWSPSPIAFGDFAHAAALRYSGSYSDAMSGGLLPGVSIWQAWNEPNLPLFLAPSSPALYRDLLNAMHDEVKAVQPAATIVTAGLAPVKSSTPAVYPKEFAQRLLCITPANGWFARDPGCPAARFDVLSLHPYSLRARPTQRAAVVGNMFVADVEDVAQMLKAAQNARSVSPGLKRLWITEFAWFTNSPNKSIGDPPELAGARTAIALYMFWHAGVTQLTWYALSDDSSAIVKGGGLYDSAGRPKPTYNALRFPFFVRLKGHRLLIWGKAPVGGDRNVSIKVLRGGKAKPVATIRPPRSGVFRETLTIERPRPAQYFAQQGPERSITLGSRDFYK
jgi:hypothetical protein